MGRRRMANSPNGERAREAIHSPARHFPIRPKGRSSHHANPPGKEPAGAAACGLLRFGRVHWLCQPVRASATQSGDVVMPGAFAGLAAGARAPTAIRMLFQHDPAEPVGTWIEMRENRRGPSRDGPPRSQCAARPRAALAARQPAASTDCRSASRRLTASRDRASGARLLHRDRPLGDLARDIPDARGRPRQRSEAPRAAGRLSCCSGRHDHLEQGESETWRLDWRPRSPSATSCRPSRPSRRPMTSASRRSSSAWPPTW